MATRFTDDLFNNTEGSDFIVRKRLPLAIQIFVVFLAAFVAIYVTASIMSYTGKKTLFFFTLTLCIGSLSWLSIYFSARLRDLVLATEYQNAMLASAAQLSTRFCLITKRDGSIVYVDPGFQKLFPHFMQTPNRNLDGLLSGAGVPQDVIQKIIFMLQQNRNDRILLSLRDDRETMLPVMVHVDVLPRPKGYFLLRGRDYVEKRSADSSAVARTDVEAPLAQALNMVQDGVLIAEGGGGILFVNPALEQWLGFEEGEVTARALRTRQIIYQYGGMDAGRLINSDFNGDVMFQRKDRTLVSMYVRQTPLGRLSGFSAIVTPSDSVKKK